MPSGGQKFIDIEEAVRRWAWKRYDKNARTRKQKQLRARMLNKDESTIAVLIDWSLVDFHDHTVWSALADDEFSEAQAERNGSVVTPTPAPAPVTTARAADTQGSDVNLLFNTEFNNNTETEQVYTLRIEKTTRSTCSTEIEQGVTKGVELGITLKMPCEVFEANAGFKREVSLTKTKGETIEEEIHWGAESTITVARNKVAKARLTVREKKQAGDFTVESQVTGNVMVRFTNLLDNNSLLFATSGQIDYVIEDFLTDERKINHSYEFVRVEDGVVRIFTKGSCRFRYGIKQEVDVQQEECKH